MSGVTIVWIHLLAFYRDGTAGEKNFKVKSYTLASHSSLCWTPFVRALQRKNFRNSISQLLTLLHSSLKFTVVLLTSRRFRPLLQKQPEKWAPGKEREPASP